MQITSIRPFPWLKTLPYSVTRAKLKKGEISGLMNIKGVKVFNCKDGRNMLTLSTVPDHSGNRQPSGKIFELVPKYSNHRASWIIILLNGGLINQIR
jgi:hypothetical protein